MSADIFLGPDQQLNLRVRTFEELIDRARRKTADTGVARQFTIATESGCLGVEGIEDPSIKNGIVDCLRAAALEWLQEPGLSERRPQLVPLLNRLIRYVDELRGETQA